MQTLVIFWKTEQGGGNCFYKCHQSCEVEHCFSCFLLKSWSGAFGCIHRHTRILWNNSSRDFALSTYRTSSDTHLQGSSTLLLTHTSMLTSTQFVCVSPTMIHCGKGCSYPCALADRGCNGLELNYFIHFLPQLLVGRQDLLTQPIGWLHLLSLGLTHTGRVIVTSPVMWAFWSPVYSSGRKGAVVFWFYLAAGHRTRPIYDPLNSLCCQTRHMLNFCRDQNERERKKGMCCSQCSTEQSCFWRLVWHRSSDFYLPTFSSAPI